MFDSPATALMLKATPWRAFGRDHRCSLSKRFRDRQTEIRVQCREDKNVSVPVGNSFRLDVNRALDRNAGEAKRGSEPGQLFIVPELRPAGDPEPPIGLSWLD